jgi:CheY-like chemotaxis protein
MNDRAVSSAFVVDDNFFNRDLCRMALEHVGYEVHEADDGRNALSVLAQRSFDLLVLDLAMPDVDGLSVIRGVIDQPQHKKMSILVITAHSHMTSNIIDIGADYVLYKPFDIEAFAQLAERLKARIS